MNVTIIDQMKKFLMNCFKLELECKNPGIIRTKTASKKINGIIWANPIFNFSRSF